MRKWVWHIPDGGVLGLELGHTDALVALFSHEAVCMQVRQFGVGHQLDHDSCWTVIMTDLRNKSTQTKHYDLFHSFSLLDKLSKKPGSSGEQEKPKTWHLSFHFFSTS